MASDVLGELLIEGPDGEPLRLTGRGQTLSLDLPTFAVGRSLAKSTPARARRRDLVARLHAALRHADVSLQVTLAGRPVAQLRPGSRPRPLSRLLGLGAVEVKPLGLVLALLGR